MGSEWENVTLGDVLTLQRGFDLSKTKRQGGNIPVVASTGITGWHSEFKVEAPGVVIGRSGSIGGSQYIDKSFWPLNTTLWVKDFKGNSERYCYYLLKSIDFSAFNVGSGVPTLNRNHIHPLPIKVPHLPEQKAIAHILGTLDDKIELNRQMNETLEAMAQALFKSWFVDFDPVLDNAIIAGNAIPDAFAERATIRKQVLAENNQANPYAENFPSEFEFTDELGWIPKGWGISDIDTECDFLNGYAFKSKELSKDSEQSIPVFKMGNINRGGGLNHEGTKSFFPIAGIAGLERYFLKKFDILIAMTDMKSSMALLGHTALMSHDDGYLVNQRVGRIRVKPSSLLNCFFVYIFSNLKSTIKELRSRANSGVQVNLSTAEIKATNILVPSAKASELYEKKVASLFEKSFKNDININNLSKLRDTLLPQLLSGKLRIADAEKMVAELS